MDVVHFPEFWATIAGFVGLAAQQWRNNQRAKTEIREEIRELRRMMVRHLEDHPRVPPEDKRRPWL